MQGKGWPAKCHWELIRYSGSLFITIKTSLDFRGLKHTALSLKNGESQDLNKNCSFR